jgi:hypothetical protein
MREKTEYWMKLCQQAAVEQDPTKLLALVTEINNLLEEKEQRLARKYAADPHARGTSTGSGQSDSGQQ